MKKFVVAACAFAIIGSMAPACSYGAIAVENGKAVIVRQDDWLYGILRKIFVCEVTDGGLANCANGENP